MSKSIALFVTILSGLTLHVLFATSAVHAQKPADAAGKVVAQGGVGESGATSLLHHQVTGKTEALIVVRNSKTDLCGNTGAIAILVVNGESKAHGAITDAKSSIQVKAKPGDHIIALVHAIPLFNQIACIRLGELSFEMSQRDLPK